MEESRHSSGHGRHDRSSRHDRHRDRRSRSPRSSDKRDHDRDRRRDHESKSSSRRDKSPRKHREEPKVAEALPFGARHLTKYDLPNFEAFLGHYLDIQKQRYIEDMDDTEVKGRWKSFIKKWNSGELAEGWYDPEMFARVTASQEAHQPTRQASPPRRSPTRETTRAHHTRDQDSDSDYGPAPVGSAGAGRRAGAGIPSMQDLAHRDEMRQESREADKEDLRAERKADRKLQKERLDELVPRAEAGTRERKLEKRQEVNNKMREFREKSPGMDASNEKELMGGGDSLAEYKQMKAQEQRRKTEREIRREEIARAKQEEMDERRRKYQEKEQGTMSMLQELARQRFG